MYDEWFVPLFFVGVLQAQNPIVKLAIVKNRKCRKRNEEDHHIITCFIGLSGRLHNNGECSIIRVIEADVPDPSMIRVGTITIW